MDITACEYIYRKGEKKGIVCNIINCEIHVYKKKLKKNTKGKEKAKETQDFIDDDNDDDCQNNNQLINTDVIDIVKSDDKLYDFSNYDTVNPNIYIYDFDILLKCLINEYQFMINNMLLPEQQNAKELSKNFLLYRWKFILNKINKTNNINVHLPILYSNYSKIDNYLYNMNENDLEQVLQTLI